MSLILTLTPTQKFSGRPHYPHLRSDVWLAGTSLSMVEAMKREMEKPYSLFSCLFHSRSWVTPREARLPASLALAPTQVFLYLFCLKIQADLARWPTWEAVASQPSSGVILLRLWEGDTEPSAPLRTPRPPVQPTLPPGCWHLKKPTLPLLQSPAPQKGHIPI